MGAQVDFNAALTAVKAAMLAQGWRPAAAIAETDNGAEIVVVYPVPADWDDLDSPAMDTRSAVADVLVALGFDEYGPCDVVSRFAPV